MMTSPPLVVTTAISPDEALQARAMLTAQTLGAVYAPRRNVTLAQIGRETGAGRMLVVEQHRLRLRDASGTEYAFHPNLATVRAHNLLRGGRDLFAEATGLTTGDTLLDCTVGFASEATLGALLVGPTGTVVGLESVPELAEVTRAGVAGFPLQNKRIEAALRRVTIVTADYREYLPRCGTGAYDVVYFDPFFDERLPGSEESVSPLALFGNLAPLDAVSVREARRVARRRVVIKHPKREALPGPLAAEVTETITTRHNRVQYDVLLAF